MNIVGLGGIAVVALSLGTLTPPVGAEKPQDRARVVESTAGTQHEQARFAEREYRHRVGKLRRLREIAAQRNDSGRLTEIDELSDRLRSRHAERISRLKDRMDERAADRLDKELADGRDRAQWVHEHREKARELWIDQREKRQEARQAVRQEKAQQHQVRHDQRMENREQRFDAHQQKRQEKFDAREHRHDRRVEHRQDRREQQSDARRQHHDQRVDHRRNRREKQSDYRRKVRGHARDRAEQQRSEAREMADRSRHEVVGHRLEQRWRKEAGSRGLERWEQAARSRGMLSSNRPKPDFRMPSQREADTEMSTRISTANAEAEFEKLRRDINRK